MIRLARYHKVASLARQPTPYRRALAAIVAGTIAFAMTQLMLGLWLGAGWNAALFSSVALGVAAAVAASTMRVGLAIVYGVIGAVWLLMEAIVLTLGCLFAVLG